MIQLYSDIKGNGPPTKSTPGAVGQIYVDVATGLRYECTEAFIQKGYKISKEVYEWEEKGLDTESLATDAEVAAVANDLREEFIAGGSTGGGTVIPEGGVSIWAEITD